MRTENIQHTILIRATPKAIYDALMNGKKHSQFTSEPAKIRAKAGGPFSCYDSYITGVTLELKPGNRIVQGWRSQDWPAGHYSILTFALAEHPAAARNCDTPRSAFRRMIMRKKPRLADSLLATAQTILGKVRRADSTTLPGCFVKEHRRRGGHVQ